MTLVRAVLFLVVTSCLIAASVDAEEGNGTERILAFHSAINLASDGSLLVTETIKVHATGAVINHGIYRDLDSGYPDQAGRPHLGAYQVQSVRRDGLNEPYFIEDVEDGMRIYCGDAGITLPPGEYTYELQYSADRHIQTDDGFDVLYWDVTGTAWTFPVDTVTAVITLPQAVEPGLVNLSAYTGAAGSRESDCRFHWAGAVQLVCETTRPLAAGENLTIVVELPQGILALPPEPAVRRTAGSTADNSKTAPATQHGRVDPVDYYAGHPHGEPRDPGKSNVIGILGLLFLAGYYLLAWHFLGRDPAKRQAPLRSTPPEGISPAAARYIEQMRFDDVTFAAALINLAIQGRLRIISAPGCQYVLKRAAPDCDGLPEEERVLWNKLLMGRDMVEVVRANHAVINNAREALSLALRKKFDGPVFRSNQAYLGGGIAISAVIVLLMIGKAPSPALLTGMAILCAISWGAFIFPLRALVKYAVPPFAGSPACGSDGAPLNPTGPIIQLVFLVPVSLAILTVMAAKVSWPVAFAIGGMIILNEIFSLLLPAYTVPGRKLMDELGGFRQWLVSSAAAGQSPDLTGEPTNLQVFLPYAMALGIEQEWSDRFEASLRDSRQPEPPSPVDEPDHAVLNQSEMQRLVSRSVTTSFQRSLTASRRPPPAQTSRGSYRSSGYRSFTSHSSGSSRSSRSSHRSSGGGRGGRGGGGW